MAELNPIELQKALKGAAYPTSRDDLVELARNNGADSTLVEKLTHSGSERFEGPDEVQKAVFDNE
ncbi:DUF2795 domain-containing protein [Streptomyces griseoflavus]|uniref:DUF2795 domain-containing protein n=1 Tax=Streptomyces griseoflavus TaxID=35619 RepID=UPI00167EAC6B|nr:DUF2795 domain-containing protein [Streptomyces griseoflavus]GGV40646.1 hypothetical protein GCM10010293_46060 [Streptomyces griseoflavus]